MTTGYQHPQYAAALSEFGRPRLLPRADGWLLERRIPGWPDRDAMGTYPLFSCRDWSALGSDLADLGSDLVSIVLVADPFGAHNPDLLTRTFNRGAVPFKEHHIADLSRPPEQIVCAHHRRNAKKALQDVRVDVVAEPSNHLDEWAGFYDVLRGRHDIRGVGAFSHRSFAQQLTVPGLVALRATADGVGVGMLLWFVRDGVATYHLGAFSERGYDLGAAFALFWAALHEFRDRAAWLSLGAGAGTDRGSAGLDRFKRGWASGTRTAYLCRHVGDPERYDAIARARGAVGTSYFPAYRVGEFAPAARPEEVAACG